MFSYKCDTYIVRKDLKATEKYDRISGFNQTLKSELKHLLHTYMQSSTFREKKRQNTHMIS